MLQKKVLMGILMMGALCFHGANAMSIDVGSPNYTADKWYRDSAERNAIYDEIYSMALNIIQRDVSVQHLQSKSWGVVLDIDETTLDNSQWDADHDIHQSKQSWNAFALEAKSVSTPGVKKFINAIHQMGGYVNLVSNRPNILYSATVNNLKAQDIYFDQVLLDTTNVGTSFVDKNARFKAIVHGTFPSKLPPQKVVAWFGDNIQDFPNLKQAALIKRNPDDGVYKQFGTKYFLLPNPMYGSWQHNDFN